MVLGMNHREVPGLRPVLTLEPLTYRVPVLNLGPVTSVRPVTDTVQNMTGTTETCPGVSVRNLRESTDVRVSKRKV